MPRLFDRYVFVDWSAAAKPSRNRDSIWFANGTADGTGPPHNVPTRAEATELLRQVLVAASARRERVLIGFDFPYGLPAGFGAALKLRSDQRPWRATWARLTECMHEGPNNANRRFHDAARLNEAIGSPPGPFWGHPQGFVDSALTWRSVFRSTPPMARSCASFATRNATSARSSGCRFPSGNSLAKARSAVRRCSGSHVSHRSAMTTHSRRSAASGRSRRDSAPMLFPRLVR